MRTRSLGRSGIHISEIGFGTWGLGGTNQGSVAYGPTSDQDSIAALKRAHALGITFYDTANLYGAGHSEQLLAQAFADRRHAVIIATKAGFVGADGVQDFSPGHLENALLQSLDRLQTSYVDLFQLHNPLLDTLYSRPDLWEFLADLKARGLARRIGISVRSPDDGIAVAADFDVDAIQVNFNLIDQRALENGLLDTCAASKIGVIIRTPLCFGFLSGLLTGNESFTPDDHRSRWSSRQCQRWAESRHLFRDLIAAVEGQTPAQFALRFCLSHPGVATVIPGMLTPGQVEENAAASDLGPLDCDDMRQIRELYQSEAFFVAKAAS